jgi:cytochrome c551/c552
VAGVLLMAACGGEGASRAASRDSAPPSAPAVSSAPVSADPRAAIFVAKGCPQCHSISALGVKSPTEVGPDLTIAYTDVQSRFNMKLDEFLKNPTGTMQIVLSSQIRLSEEEREKIAAVLIGLEQDKK